MDDEVTDTYRFLLIFVKYPLRILCVSAPYLVRIATEVVRTKYGHDTEMIRRGCG